jgi:hypothetical protein
VTYSHSKVFILVYLGYLVVGLGSMAFHTTLKCSSLRPPTPCNMHHDTPRVAPCLTLRSQTRCSLPTSCP